MAEVESITVGGSIIIQGDFQDPELNSFNDDDGRDAFYQQRTRINVDAKLSGGVSAFVELQAYDFWGNDLGEAELTVDPPLNPAIPNFVHVGVDDQAVSIYQAYINIAGIADQPLDVRLGRQELVYGEEWLVGNNDAGRVFPGLSFDSIKATYSNDMCSVDLWTAKLEEGAINTSRDDIDFYGAYATSSAVEGLTIDAYLLLIRDPSASGDTDNLYTVGGRVAGAAQDVFDYSAEVAFQFGDTNTPAGEGDYEGIGIDLMAGVNLPDLAGAPRIELAYTYLSGDDDPTDKDNENFQRLFSDVHYGEANLGGDLDARATNLHILRLGASGTPVEKVTISGDIYYFMLADDDGLVFGAPQGDDDDEVGIELDLAVDYAYTEDLNLRVGWAHFFVDDAIENATGGDDDDVDYLYVKASLDF
jgi:hypothetical protein